MIIIIYLAFFLLGAIWLGILSVVQAFCQSNVNQTMFQFSQLLLLLRLLLLLSVLLL